MRIWNCFDEFWFGWRVRLSCAVVFKRGWDAFCCCGDGFGWFAGLCRLIDGVDWIRRRLISAAGFDDVVRVWSWSDWVCGCVCERRICDGLICADFGVMLILVLNCCFAVCGFDCVIGIMLRLVSWLLAVLKWAQVLMLISDCVKFVLVNCCCDCRFVEIDCLDSDVKKMLRLRWWILCRLMVFEIGLPGNLFCVEIGLLFLCVLQI